MENNSCAYIASPSSGEGLPFQLSEHYQRTHQSRRSYPAISRQGRKCAQSGSPSNGRHPSRHWRSRTHPRMLHRRHRLAPRIVPQAAAGYLSTRNIGRCRVGQVLPEPRLWRFLGKGPWPEGPGSARFRSSGSTESCRQARRERRSLRGRPVSHTEASPEAPQEDVGYLSRDRAARPERLHRSAPYGSLDSTRPKAPSRIMDSRGVLRASPAFVVARLLRIVGWRRLPFGTWAGATLHNRAMVWVSTKAGRMLSGRRSRDTRPERLLRSALHAKGGRFRLHRRLAPECTPDLVLPRHRVAVWVDGCFWHSCPIHGRKTPFAGPNADLWRLKLDRTQQRDLRAVEVAQEAGWRTLRLWECEVVQDPTGAAARVLAASCLPSFTRAG
jgi:DNA mismatch endonuclease, patch repair protein